MKMNQMEQRIMLLDERNHMIPNQGMTTLIGCEPNQQEEESVFLTPRSSPAYSHDGNGYSNDIGYFSATCTPPTSMTHPLQQLAQPPVSPNGTYMTPGSPCDDFCSSSPYSPPYDNSSPHSIACSSTPNGSPISCTDVTDFTPYVMAPDSTMHDIPSPQFVTPVTSLPYTSETDTLVYSNVPTSTSGYYTGVMPTQSHWMSEDGLPNFDGYIQSEHPHIHHHHLPRHIMEGEVLVNIIDQTGVDPEMMPPQISYYQDGSPTPSPDSQHSIFCPDMVAMQMHQEMAACQPFTPPHKSSTKLRKVKKHKPVIQVNDEHIKDIPTSAQLWEFTLRVLKKPAYHYMINWENKKEGLFRFHDAPAFAALWGKHRNRPNMTYDKVARALRYYYKRDILNQVGGRLTYRFSKRLGKLYAVEE